ncbi:hypothetical protein [Methanofollis formosanus]|uniref:hypothetical protein n=1 Tax=Methanofollis formosanus TaxID=299308 RepID=UPI001C7DF038|nr:hypothetical protein [Methanofollis formosanus]
MVLFDGGLAVPQWRKALKNSGKMRFGPRGCQALESFGICSWKNDPDDPLFRFA